ncbi:MAG: FHA domain-containing protein [Planctomycetota bacterium]|nr:FHA domain-containing protein [Planctomycetota bacterium]
MGEAPVGAIIVGTGNQEGLFLALGKRSTVVGRDESLPLQIEDERVSRKHVQFRLDPATNNYVVMDLQSTNGTSVNDRRIFTETVLADGDVITIGNTKLLFTLEIPTDKANALAVYKKVGEKRRSTLIR